MECSHSTDGTPQKRNEGMALVMATVLVAVMALILGAMSMRSISQSQQASQYDQFTDCFHGVEAAVADAWVQLETTGGGDVGLGSWEQPEGAEGFVLPSFDSEGVQPATLPDEPNVQYMAVAQDWSNDGIDNNGDGMVDEPDENFTYTLHGLARNRGVERQVELILSGSNVNVWRNAIFAGAGQAGGLINGNVSIHGSVHLLGENIISGGTAITALDMSGTSLIHNNYESLGNDLAVRVPPLPTRTFNGEVVETLSAKLRVRNGYVSLSGNSEVGEPHQTGNSFKETMDGTYVNDGWTGNAVIDDGDRGDPTSVWSDNGWDELYDLGNKVPFPALSDDYKDMNTGDTYINPGTGANYTHAEYFNDQLSGAAYNGNLTISTGQDFYYNGTRPNDPDPANRQPGDDYIYFDSSNDLMDVNGQIEINGDLEITGSGNDTTIHYTGRAALLVNGNATLDTDLLTVNADGTIADSFPANNILGIMASGDMMVGSKSQLKLMGAFYAQDQITSQKQTIVMGTFVANYFDMGTNVPDIYQVPDLADNLPLGMIGAFPILVFERVSWREIGV